MSGHRGHALHGMMYHRNLGGPCTRALVDPANQSGRETLSVCAVMSVGVTNVGVANGGKATGGKVTGGKVTGGMMTVDVWDVALCFGFVKSSKSVCGFVCGWSYRGMVVVVGRERSVSRKRGGRRTSWMQLVDPIRFYKIGGALVRQRDWRRQLFRRWGRREGTRD